MESSMNPRKVDISAIILAKNEAQHLPACLKSLAWVDERIVVDNGSTDDSPNIAVAHGATVIPARDNDFARLRNAGKEAASSEWLLYVDADEQATPELQDELIKVVRQYDPEQSPVWYFIRRKNYYLGKPWPYIDKLERFFRKEALLGWQGQLHETAIVRGTGATLHGPLIHITHRTLEEMVTKTNEWSEVEAKLRLRAKHPAVVWWRLLRVMVTGFYDSFIRQGGWKAGTAGFIESMYQGFSMFITYAKLWEMQQKKPQK